MRLLRSVLFWLHLAAGLLAGVFVAIMSFTGALLAFEPELVAWAARDMRRIEPPAAHTTALPLDDLISRAREAATATTPDSTQPPRVTGITISADPREAVSINFGRDLDVYYINQYTGEVRPPAAERLQDFLHFVEDVHRRLAFAGDHRETGRAITGAANAAFLFLALSGLWLWWPRQWSARFLRPALSYVRGARGRARDWNWHNALGFWSLPVLVVLTATGIVISYRWASDLAYRAVGETPPAANAAPAADFKIDRPADTTKLTYAAVLARLQTEHPLWTEITLREGLPARRGAPAAASATPAPTEPKRPRGPQPYSATLKADDGAPHFATTQVVLNPFTGETLDRAGYAELSPGRRVRLWLRHLHTGYALGWPGQFVAGLACLAACVLVYTGFALSWRRFFTRRRVAAATAISAVS
jgi:uncharacterized iron-regulated membrane protein